MSVHPREGVRIKAFASLVSVSVQPFTPARGCGLKLLIVIDDAIHKGFTPARGCGLKPPIDFKTSGAY